MSESELQWHPEIQSSLTSDPIEEIVKLCPPDIVEDVREDYAEKIKALGPDEQKKILDLWKNEYKKTLWVLISLIRWLKITSQDRISTSQEILTTTVISVWEEKEKRLYSEALEASKSALNITKSIEKTVGNTYTSEIQSRIETSYTDDKTQGYFKTLGIDITHPEARSNPEVQKILEARVSTQVYLEKSDEISRTHPELNASLRELSSLRFKLGIESTSKDITSLLPDVPRDTRNQIEQTVTTINSGFPDNPITRKGDVLSLKDPRNDRLSYTIDLSNQPPTISKTLKGISISREVATASPEFLIYQKDKSRFEVWVKKFLEQSKREPFIAAMELDERIFEEAVKWGMKEVWLLDMYKGSKRLMNKAFENSIEQDSNGNTLWSLSENREWLRQKWLAIYTLTQYLRANGNESEAWSLDQALIIIEWAIRENDSQIAKYTEISERGVQLSKTMKTKTDGESIIDWNLIWLSDELLIGRIWPRANEILDRIITMRNQNRTDGNKINLSGKIIDALDKKAIQEDFRKIIEWLWFQLSDLRTEKIGMVIKRINEALTIPNDSKGSIWRLIQWV
jgi:hypothetical protein